MLNREFHGTWIQPPCWAPEDAAQTRLVCFRRGLSLRERPESCPVQITAAGRYKLYVNGELVQFGPAKGDKNNEPIATVTPRASSPRG